MAKKMDTRLEKGLMPRDVLPPSESVRMERADRMTSDLRRMAMDDGHRAMVVGQLLHDVFRQELWRGSADTWKEYINDVGLTPGKEFERRKNYEYYILELGMDATDPRLSEAPSSKLAVGTRKRFKGWVQTNIDEFLDLARLPFGEGGLDRANLSKYIEEQLGITDEHEDSQTMRVIRAFRRAVIEKNKLTDDAWDIFLGAVRNDEDLFNALNDLVASAKMRSADIVFDLEDEDEDD